MTLTLRVGSLTVLTTSVSSDADIVISFSGSRWFGWRLAIAAKDQKNPKGGTSAVIVNG